MDLHQRANVAAARSLLVHLPADGGYPEPIQECHLMLQLNAPILSIAFPTDARGCHRNSEMNKRIIKHMH